MLHTSTRHEAPHYAVCCLFPFRSKYFEHTVLVRERPSFIRLTIGNCVMCSPCQINLSLLRQICALFVYDLLATRRDSITKTHNWPRSEAATNFRLLSGRDCIREHPYHISTALSLMQQHHSFRSSASESQKYW